MAGDKCDRRTAMGNMDAYLENPNDWAFGRLEAKRKGITYDYVTLDVQQIILATVWSAIVAFFVGRGIYSYTYHVPYVRTKSVEDFLSPLSDDCLYFVPLFTHVTG
jgi:hypothetical protein